MNLNVELKGITGPNGLALSKSMVKQVEEQLTNLNQNQEVLISSFNVVLVKLAEEIMPHNITEQLYSIQLRFVKTGEHF